MIKKKSVFYTQVKEEEHLEIREEKQETLKQDKKGFSRTNGRTREALAGREQGGVTRRD